MSQIPTGSVMDHQDIRDPQTAQKYIEVARKAEGKGERWAAIEAYEAAFAADPDNPETCFRLAYLLDLVGEEDEALHLYEQAVQRANAPLNALMNLAILYEDRNIDRKSTRLNSSHSSVSRMPSSA